MKSLIIIASIFAACSIHAQSVASLQSEIASLKTTVAALQKQVTLIAQNPALQLGPFVSINTNPVNSIKGPLLVIKGVNVMIDNGMGATNLMNGLGNLILGYQEATILGTTQTSWVMGPNDRMGSHNLLLGRCNKWTNNAYAGIVSGITNIIDGDGSSVLSGEENVASGGDSIVVGGLDNRVLSGTSAIFFGVGNRDNAMLSVIASGDQNTTNGMYSTILSGDSQTTTTANQVIQ
jgi:hypothetical protein